MRNETKMKIKQPDWTFNTTSKYFCIIILLLCFYSCRNHYDIEGRFINVCGQPVPGIPVIFAGCTERGKGYFGEPNTEDFEFSTVSDANGRFSFTKRKSCDNVWLTINGSSRSFIGETYHFEDTIKGFHTIFLHYHLQNGDSISKVYLSDPLLIYPHLFVKTTDSSFQIKFFIEKQRFEFVTEFYRNALINLRVDSGLYDCSKNDLDVFIKL